VSSSGYAPSVTATSASVVDTVGLVTGFWVYPVPRLAIAVKTNSVIIRWPEDKGLLHLESSHQLGPNAPWQVVTTVPVTSYGIDTVTLPLAPGSEATYFRLVGRATASAEPPPLW